MIEALKVRRGRGRDDYPIEAMWRALIAGVVFQHSSIASLVRELRRNPALLQVCGFAALPRRGRTVRTLQRDAQTGQAKIKAWMGLAVCVMMALALGAALENRPGRMRSLVNLPFDDAG